VGGAAMGGGFDRDPIFVKNRGAFFSGNIADRFVNEKR